MGTLTTTKVTAGKDIESNDINIPLQETEAIINGGIDSTNLAPGAIITSTLGDASVTSTKYAPTIIRDHSVTTTAVNSTTNISINDLTQTITASSGDYAIVTASLDVSQVTNGAAFIGVLHVNSAEQDSKIIFDPDSTGGRSMNSQTWLVPLGTGSNTIEILARISTAGGSFSVLNTHSTLTTQVINGTNATSSN